MFAIEPGLHAPSPRALKQVSLADAGRLVVAGGELPSMGVGPMMLGTLVRRGRTWQAGYLSGWLHSREPAVASAHMDTSLPVLDEFGWERVSYGGEVNACVSPICRGRLPLVHHLVECCRTASAETGLGPERIVLSLTAASFDLLDGSARDREQVLLALAAPALADALIRLRNR